MNIDDMDHDLLNHHLNLKNSKSGQRVFICMRNTELTNIMNYLHVKVLTYLKYTRMCLCPEVILHLCLSKM